MKVNTVEIGKYSVGENQPPFIIAEMSGNHNQSLERALELVEIAAKTGVHAIKLQTYTPDTMTLDLSRDEFFIQDKDNIWEGSTLYDLYKEAHTPWEWHQPIMERARLLGLECFSSPFDETSVDFLETLNVPCYKIASFENIDLPLIKKAASTGKPLIISTGMASLAELDGAVSAARDAGCKDLILLKCTSTYPALPENTNIQTIPHMKSLFGCQVGLSDHSMGLGVSIASVALGATIIEKHFTTKRSDGGVDSTFSMEPEEMAGLVVETKRAWESMGKISYGPTEAEKKSLKFRRSLYITENMKKGDVLSTDNLRAIRPGLGISPKYIDDVVGLVVKTDVIKGTAFNWGIVI